MCPDAHVLRPWEGAAGAAGAQRPNPAFPPERCGIHAVSLMGRAVGFGASHKAFFWQHQRSRLLKADLGCSKKSCKMQSISKQGRHTKPSFFCGKVINKRKPLISLKDCMFQKPRLQVGVTSSEAEAIPRTGVATAHKTKKKPPAGLCSYMAMGQNPVPPVTLKSLLKRW